MKKEDANIDVLLNSFLDGELTERERTEVERLLTHDAEIAKRFAELEKCRMLVGSLPYAEAPAEVLERIKESAGEMPVSSSETKVFEQYRGARHLLIRQVVSIAAMVVLVAVLGVVIYTILGPESVGKRPMVAEDLRLPAKKIEVEPSETVQPMMAKAEETIEQAKLLAGGFRGRLELKTKALVATDASVNRAIEDSGLAQYSVSRKEAEQRVYTVAGSREAVGLLLSDLANIWGRFDSTSLLVETETSERVVVDNVKTEQVAKIVKQDSPEARIKVAKDIAAFNRIEKHLPGEEMFAAIDYGKADLITIPKPVLTSSEKAVTKPVGGAEAKQEVILTIVVAGSK
jgi:anti-sigma factor RsiW